MLCTPLIDYVPVELMVFSGAGILQQRKTSADWNDLEKKMMKSFTHMRARMNTGCLVNSLRSLIHQQSGLVFFSNMNVQDDDSRTFRD